MITHHTFWAGVAISNAQKFLRGVHHPIFEFKSVVEFLVDLFHNLRTTRFLSIVVLETARSWFKERLRATRSNFTYGQSIEWLKIATRTHGIDENLSNLWASCSNACVTSAHRTIITYQPRKKLFVVEPMHRETKRHWQNACLKTSKILPQIKIESTCRQF